MKGIEIRPLEPEEFHEALFVSSAAFGEQVTEEDEKVYRSGFPFDRSLCAYENGRIVGTSTVLPMELTLPGGSILPTGGLTWVSVLPTHRRRGILRRLLTAQFSDMANRGEALSALIASEGNIYGRFGYGPATSVTSFSVERAHSALATPVEDPGRVVMLGADEASVQLPSIYESLRLLQPGALSRSESWWAEYLYDPPQHREGGGTMFHAKHEAASGDSDGYVTYRVREEWEGGLPQSSALVVELMAENPRVYRVLWNFVLSTDLCRTISFSRGRVDEPLRWLLADPRRLRVEALADYLWLRLVDVPRALAARTYGSPGRFVLEVAGARPDPTAECFVLDVSTDGQGRADCSPTTAPPDISIPLESLGAVYLGGVSLTALAIGGRVHELTAGAVERADAMFRTSRAPYCVTEF